jgi:hypothetical protein
MIGGFEISQISGITKTRQSIVPSPYIDFVVKKKYSVGKSTKSF